MTAFDEFASAFQASAGFDRDRAESLARLAMTVFDLHAPQEFTAELISPDDGISEGQPRALLLSAFSTAQPEEFEVHYRGYQINVVVDSISASASVVDPQRGPLQWITRENDLTGAIALLHDLDTWIDVIRQDPR